MLTINYRVYDRWDDNTVLWHSSSLVQGKEPQMAVKSQLQHLWVAWTWTNSQLLWPSVFFSGIVAEIESALYKLWVTIQMWITHLMMTTTIVIITTPLPLPEYLEVLGIWLQVYLHSLLYWLIMYRAVTIPKILCKMLYFLSQLSGDLDH